MQSGRKNPALFAALLGLCLAATAFGSVSTSRSPENQVFQFTATGTFTPGAKPGMASRTADAYLWVPEQCQRVRGVLILAQNVPEHWLAGHPAIRSACADNGLAILYACRSFLMLDTYKNYPWQERNREHGKFVQQLLDDLAKVSGYGEVATAPWFPMGESMALMVPNALTSAYPDRCIAGIQIKDGVWRELRSPAVPVLVSCGTGKEWDLPKHDIFSIWKEQASWDLREHCAKRAAMPSWPGSLVIEAGSAHFSCSEKMAEIYARYIRAACKARLADDGGPALKPVHLEDGYLAGLPVPGSKPLKPVRYGECPPDRRNLPWYFDEAAARAAFEMADVNWNASPQLPVFADAAGNPVPFNARGITGPLPWTTAEDGITFELGSAFLEKLPDRFIGAGKSIGHVQDKPILEWLCGPFIPLGGNRFQFAMDRTWNKTDCYVRVWHPGDANYRLSTNPGRLNFDPNRQGKPQKISFPEIPDQKAGTKEVKLEATSDSGMTVRFFVRSGPAIVRGDRLVFTPIPPRSKMPLAVNVVAWQWGRSSGPRIQTAEPVERTFRIIN
mgnify:CR=1 FL=1